MSALSSFVAAAMQAKLSSLCSNLDPNGTVKIPTIKFGNKVEVNEINKYISDCMELAINNDKLQRK